MSQTRDKKGFITSKVADDWHELMIPQRIMWPSIAPRCSQQTYHGPSEPRTLYMVPGLS